MRISDWSSDVCSSDLPSPIRTRLASEPSLMLRCLHARVMLALGHVHLRASRVGACVARHRDTPLPRAGMVRMRLYPLTVPRLFEPMACARVMGIDQSLALRCLRPDTAFCGDLLRAAALIDEPLAALWGPETGAVGGRGRGVSHG